MQQYEGRLELTWTNKHLHLLATEDGGYEWVPATDYRVAEVRLLHNVTMVGDCRSDADRAADNLLIRGDALHALTSLTELPEFAHCYAGKVKLCYIDPPFNTGQAFVQYDDALEHSVWLTMMRDRLLQVRELLAPEGSVWVHLDQGEVHYCKIAMDEIFGRANFVGEIIWRAADSSNNDAKQFSVDHNSILVYSKEPGWRSVALARDEENNAHYANSDNDPRGDWFPGNVSSPNPRKKLRFVIDESFNWKGTPILPPANGWRWQPATIREKIDSGEIVLREDEPGRPRLIRKTYLADQGGLAPSSMWGDIEETGHNRQAKYELKKLFPGIPTSELFKTPKPERLIWRILQVASEPGDLVLDFFVGSGATAAVAAKTERRWIGVEWSGDTLAKFALPRLRRVASGDDPGGITEMVGWEGDSSFRVLDVAPSMFEEDQGLVVLSEWATNGDLAEATAAQLGYEFVQTPPFCGTKGRTRLAVIDGLVNDAVVRLLAGTAASRERIVVCGTGIDPAARTVLKELLPGSTLRKIPASILDEYRLPGRRPTLADMLDWVHAVDDDVGAGREEKAEVAGRR